MIHTGSIGLDIALGGGWRPGTLNEVWGDPGAAKTVLALHSAENAVRAGHEVLWIDLDDGVRHMTTAPKVIVGRPHNAEQAFGMAEHGCRYEDIGLVVIDPAQMLVRQRELDGDPDYVPHPQREYARELSSLKRVAKASGTVVLFVSQPRDKEREPVRGTGISEKVHYRVHLHPDVVHQDGERLIQATLKNMLSKQVTHDAALFSVSPGKGINQARELVVEGLRWGVIIQRGTWLAWNNTQAQGTDGMARSLSSAQLRDLEDEIRINAGIG